MIIIAKRMALLTVAPCELYDLGEWQIATVSSELHPPRLGVVLKLLALQLRYFPIVDIASCVRS